MDRLTLPDGFEIQTVSEFCRETKSGSTPSRTNNEYWENGTISWVKSGEVHNNITLQTEEYITPLGLNESSTKLLSSVSAEICARTSLPAASIFAFLSCSKLILSIDDSSNKYR